MKSLKKGWCPLSYLCKKYKIDQGQSNRMLKNLDDKFKEQIGRTWVVYEKQFLYISHKIDEVNNSIEEQIEMFADLLSQKLNLDKSIQLFKFIINSGTEDAIKELLSVCMELSIQLPIDIIKRIKQDELIKYNLAIQIYNLSLEHKKS
ncbi:hypothetical protein [Clostridium sporogenes]|uniref:hypothetical protein n=1 Tax=Clostridium sporogenes TaxID=1509 RepID=UPI000717817C|nr:hypothetical protein [Clostridium sporogenes]KRU40014.1 hypothetical protein VT94_24910 [Clostridium sporogenes]MBY7065169.1 hypothetical protein [Clostridium sporogenes]MBY7071861.1 hypothetical protein [Clostridium sporogenes]MCW6064761.1 hypothetical protein [Clostridium sporogenes]OQP88512.1 hypothetical protein VT93_0201560 [Clostridium sporogenes]